MPSEKMSATEAWVRLEAPELLSGPLAKDVAQFIKEDDLNGLAHFLQRQSERYQAAVGQAADITQAEREVTQMKYSKPELIYYLMQSVDARKDPELFQNLMNDYEKASEEDLLKWYQETKKPEQGGNEYTAAVETEAVENEAYKNATEPSRNSFSPISEEARDKFKAEIAKDVETLENEIQQSKKPENEPER